MDIIYQKLDTTRIGLAMEMNHVFRPGFVTEQGAYDFLKDGRNWLFAALLDGKIIAFAFGYELERLDGGKTLYIHEVGVAQPYQKKGVGTGLICALKRACRERGVTKFFLWTDQANAGANALYRKCGGELGVDSHGNDRVYWFIL